MSEIATTYAPLPADDLSRALAFAQLDSPTAQHIGLVGNTYTITVAGKDTNGRFCVIDMHVPPGGGPGPHRHDFEETFILLEGEVEMTFRGRSPSFGRVTRSTFRPMLLTSFTTHRQAQPG